MLTESACVTWYFLSFSTKSILGMKFTRSLLCGWIINSPEKQHAVS